jgi:hypothetical protein
MNTTIIKFGWNCNYAIPNDKVHLFLKAFEEALKVEETYIKGHENSVWYVCNQQRFPSMNLANETTFLHEDTVTQMKEDAENGA